jgi:hypothetical protein
VRRFGIEADHGLVKDPNCGIVYQSACEGDFLLHAVRIALYQVGSSVLQLKHIQIIFNTFPSPLRGHLVDIGHKVQILCAGKSFVQVGVVRYIADVFLRLKRIFADIRAIDRNAAFIGKF